VTVFLVVTLFAGALSLVFLIAGLSALRRGRAVRLANHLLFALLSFTLAALFATLAVSTRGYQALTEEQTIATVTTRQTGPRRFEARFTFGDKAEKVFELAGDELYVDAHILKWQPIGNILGLKTVYELDRVAGRYSRLEDEQSLTRTVYSLADNKPLDLFDLRRRYRFLGPLVDAEYGSATFLPALNEGRYTLRVSTSGLLIRKLKNQ
jgi:hypothetical protein